MISLKSLPLIARSYKKELAMSDTGNYLNHELKEVDVRKFLLIGAMIVLFLSAGVVYGAPIHDVAAKGDWNTVERLLKTGVPVDILNQQGQTPLFMAAGAGYLGVAKLLLKWGANPNIVDKEKAGKNPTDIAKFNGKTDVDELLRKHGGKYHYKATWNP